MSTLTALRHPSMLLQSGRRYRDAADHVDAALHHDRRWNPVRIGSASEGADCVGRAVHALVLAVRSDDVDRCQHAVTEVAVAALRMTASLDTYAVGNSDRAYDCARDSAWGELLASLEKHPRSWVSIHEGFGVLLEEAFELGEAAEFGQALAQVRAEAIQVAAMAIRFIADLVNTGPRATQLTDKDHR
ncbi:hypothetical protein [Mycobacteroides salmoniphilum]|uniref:Uncharacterized protein n=1 Tax=Mycobacteroides salmoniphilum TaxID=404941 RepID=A0A4R8T000_9MYCO|nr:hypothetical protein [Mycobacteroides salmoniphilum]TEA09220.1 hypothetical protein CCUG60884_00210 [Mycobacteroides salmoniphilum]